MKSRRLSPARSSRFAPIDVPHRSSRAAPARGPHRRKLHLVAAGFAPARTTSPAADQAAKAIHSGAGEAARHRRHDLHQDDRHADRRSRTTPSPATPTRRQGRHAAAGDRPHRPRASRRRPASEPTSVIGTRIASPNIAAAAVSARHQRRSRPPACRRSRARGRATGARGCGGRSRRASASPRRSCR